MTQDRILQDLQEMVEELRQRVQVLETDRQPKNVHASYVASYVASATSNRKTFHLDSCRFTGRLLSVPGGLHKFQSHDDAVAAGYQACKACRP